MLDLDALIGEMHDLASELVASAQQTRQQRESARAQLEVARGLQAQLRKAVQAFSQDMALPAEDRDMGHTIPAPAAGDYTVIATDGSQIAPDYHHIAPWYVINAGLAVFRYGPPSGRARCLLDSRAQLKPPRRNLPTPTQGDRDPSSGAAQDEDARAAAVGLGPRVEVERLKAELELATALLDEEADPGRTVLLLDGPLIQWRMIQDLKGPERKSVIRAFGELVSKSREKRVPIAGFISRSRAVEWVTLLRFSLCPSVADKESLCAECRKSLLGRNTEPPPGAHHAPLAGLRDIELAAQLLPPGVPGTRTEVIELQSSAWSEVGEGEGAAGFFYLHTGSEIARVELPQWVWEDDEQMKLLHSVVADQCDSGRGYPMVLAEAHEAAVVRAADRELFYTLIDRVVRDHDGPEAVPSAKALSKRRPLA